MQHRQRGVSLIELILFIVIIGVALISLTGLMSNLTRGSADPMIHKQALAVAESLLEEIQMQDFSVSGVAAAVCPGAISCVTAINRASIAHISSDYNGFSMSSVAVAGQSGILPLANPAATVAASGLSGYSASVTVTSPTTSSCLPNVTPASQAIITVTVTPPAGDTVQSVGCVVDLGAQ